MDVVIFLLAQEAYALPVAHVQEIQAYQPQSPPRRVPDTPPFFEGLMDLRGQVIPVVDLRQQFGLGRCEPSRRTSYIVLDLEAQEKIALLVDSVLEVQRIKAGVFQAPSLSLRTAVQREYIAGVGRLPAKSADQAERLVVLLDLAHLTREWLGNQTPSTP